MKSPRAYYSEFAQMRLAALLVAGVMLCGIVQPVFDVGTAGAVSKPCMTE
ncbi:MAG: hypothetical protein IJR63_08745 [Synergistaceae bacterium]|nr:hypothetical protein [Synergistaceae bacterium]